MRLFIKEKVLCLNNKYILSYKKGNLIVRDFKNKEKIISKTKIGSIYDKIEILGRIKRSEPRCAVWVDEESCLISHNGVILNYNIKKNIYIEEHRYNKNMRNPLNFCVKNNRDGKKEIYYGEYIWNENKGPVAIYRRRDNVWKKIYEFKNNIITHIHNIIYDEDKNKFFILTGDENSESGIWFADCEFKVVNPIIIGKQLFRSCVLFPTKQGFIYATDTPLEKNWIVEAVLKDEKVQNINKLFSIPGSSIYGIKHNGKYIFSTTVEPDSTLGKWRYRFTYKLGAGIKDRFSHLIVIEEEMKKQEILKEKKDIFPLWLCQFGNIQFPYNETNKLLITTQALKCGHGNTYEIGEVE